MSIFNGTADDIFNKKTDYPIGSICMFNTNTDPNEMYGGTWVRIKGKFILGADDDTYPLGSEGGEAETLLTVEKMPRHYHDKILINLGQEYEITYGNSLNPGAGQSAVIEVNGNTSIHTSMAGGNQPHNNMPPYVAFYIWAKVA